MKIVFVVVVVPELGLESRVLVNDTQVLYHWTQLAKQHGKIFNKILAN